MGVHGINKKKFDGGDELIRKAFKIYSDKDLESSMEDFGFEYRDDKVFEDKIYKVIKKLPIKNPRSKAHIICIAVICMVLVFVSNTYNVIYTLFDAIKSYRNQPQLKQKMQIPCFILLYKYKNTRNLHFCLCCKVIFDL